jgi:antitoxin HicB
MNDYTLEIHHEAAGVWVTCVEVPEMHASGDTLADALADAADAMDTALSLYVDQRRPIPNGRWTEDPRTRFHLSALTAAKVALWNTMIEVGIGRGELAGRLLVSRQVVDRLVDILHTSKIEQVERALAALGRRIHVSVEAA